MGKRLLTTPRGQVRSALRRVWNRSRERAFALKREGYCCERCGIKQSKAKGREVAVVVHHRNGVNWDGLIGLIFERLIVPPEELEVLCVGCHEKHHEKEPEIVD